MDYGIPFFYILVNILLTWVSNNTLDLDPTVTILSNCVFVLLERNRKKERTHVRQDLMKAVI